MHTSTRPTAAQTRVIDAYRTCEFATVTRSGTPIAWPIVSWQRPDGSFMLTTSIGLPQKAFNVRRNPAVAMLFSDATASGMIEPPHILVQGTATCPDDIVTDVSTLPEYWTKLMRRQPSGKMLSSLLGRQMMSFYYLRLIITVTPTAVISRPSIDASAPLIAPAVSRAGRTNAVRAGRHPVARPPLRGLGSLRRRRTTGPAESPAGGRHFERRTGLRCPGGGKPASGTGQHVVPHP